MWISIVIAAHNEEAYLRDCLDSFVAQTRRPDELILVDDNSSDATYEIADGFAAKHPWIKVFKRQSCDRHLPGKKVVDSFNFGLQEASDFDLIGKFDADIVLPPKYFESMQDHFQADWLLGMCSGLLYVKKGGEWVYENIADKTHIRGPIKLYHRACFEKIGGLRPGTGWDTVDILLAKYHKFGTLTLPELRVRHLRPTGHGYSSKNHMAKGGALYKMRYGPLLAFLATLKMAWQAKRPMLLPRGLLGYMIAFFRQEPFYVSKKEGRFIRAHRWEGIRSKLKGPN